MNSAVRNKKEIVFVRWHGVNIFHHVELFPIIKASGRSVNLRHSIVNRGQMAKYESRAALKASGSMLSCSPR
jgi:hypothetical protein